MPPSPFREKEERFHDFCSFVLLMVDDDDGAKTARTKNVLAARLFSSWKKHHASTLLNKLRSTTKSCKCVSVYTLFQPSH